MPAFPPGNESPGSPRKSTLKGRFAHRFGYYIACDHSSQGCKPLFFIPLPLCGIHLVDFKAEMMIKAGL
jgi:hypothetical protein